MSLELESAVNSAISKSSWDLGNQVLYDLCQKYPLHNDRQAVLAKIWLIGRSYAAAIERRKNKKDLDQNDDFYINKVAPAIIDSGIDKWIADAAEHNEIDDNSLRVVLSTHFKVTELFKKITELEKRSLASKYLHFHLPNLFYIYDARAVEAISMLSPVVGRAGSYNAESDVEYRKFATKCLSLQKYIKCEFGVKLTPRQIDNLLLYVYERKNIR